MWLQVHRWRKLQIVEVEQGCQESLSINPDVVVASIPSLTSTDRQGTKGHRLQKLNPKEFKAIIVDEAHHGVSKSYRSIFDYFGVLKKNSTTLLWGCTATPTRIDKQSLTPIFGPVLYSVNMMELISNGFLSDLQIVTAKTNEQLEVNAYYKFVVDKWKQYALSQNRRSTLVFVKKLEDIPILCKAFNNAGFTSIDSITQSTEQAKREMATNNFKNGALSVLVNCGRPLWICIAESRVSHWQPQYRNLCRGCGSASGRLYSLGQKDQIASFSVPNDRQRLPATSRKIRLLGHWLSD